MRAPSPRALTDRARTLVVQMHSVERWAYAVDSAVPAESVRAATGFVPQSSLLRRAYDVGQDDARKALTTLAHMVVVWDEDWADLFLLHLASPDPIVRHDAVLATVVAALSSREREHARVLLDEARRHEKFPRLADTMTEALAAVERIPSSPTPPARA
jgi:hypothetical protein